MGGGEKNNLRNKSEAKGGKGGKKRINVHIKKNSISTISTYQNFIRN